MKMKIVVIIILVLSVTTTFAQKVYQTEDGYVAIDATRMSTAFREVRDDNFAPGGRVTRHHIESSQNKKISVNFIIAPIDISGPDGAVLTWAEAAGWHKNANNTSYKTPATATETGCSQYQGKDGKDEKGTWRLPTQRELILMWILNPVLKKSELMTPLAEEYYFSATEFYLYDNYDEEKVCMVHFKNGQSIMSGVKGLDYTYVNVKTRCIKDVKPTTPAKKR